MARTSRKKYKTTGTRTYMQDILLPKVDKINNEVALLNNVKELISEKINVILLGDLISNIKIDSEEKKKQYVDNRFVRRKYRS